MCTGSGNGGSDPPPPPPMGRRKVSKRHRATSSSQSTQTDDAGDLPLDGMGSLSEHLLPDSGNDNGSCCSPHKPSLSTVTMASELDVPPCPRAGAMGAGAGCSFCALLQQADEVCF